MKDWIHLSVSEQWIVLPPDVQAIVMGPVFVMMKHGDARTVTRLDL